VFCDEITCDFSALGAPVTTISRDAWCQRTKQAFAGWTATHHAISNLRCAIDGDRATVQAHIHAEHWAPREVAAGGPNCWLVVGFYDNVAARTPQGWRLKSVTLTLSHQENEALLAATPDPVEPDDEGEAPPSLGLAAPVTAAVLGWVLLGQALSPLQLAGFAVTVAAIAYGATLPAASSPDVVQVVDGVVDEVAGERRDGEGGAVTAPTGAVPLRTADGGERRGDGGRGIVQLAGDDGGVVRPVALGDGSLVLVPVGEQRVILAEHAVQPLVVESEHVPHMARVLER
jgi:SnoaL-like domain